MALGPLLGNHALYRFVVVGIARVRLLSLYIDTAVTVNVPTEKLSFVDWRAIAWLARKPSMWISS
jgi:hypothetical protein